MIPAISRHLMLDCTIIPGVGLCHCILSEIMVMITATSQVGRAAPCGILVPPNS